VRYVLLQSRALKPEIKGEKKNQLSCDYSGGFSPFSLSEWQKKRKTTSAKPGNSARSWGLCAEVTV
jgi:hypothetical protein